MMDVILYPGGILYWLALIMIFVVILTFIVTIYTNLLQREAMNQMMEEATWKK